jgi:hypothetical protein
VEVTDEGLISRADFTYDLDDPQTVTYLEYLAAQPDDGDEPPPPGLVTVALAPQPGGSQPGSAFIFTDEGVTLVALEIVPGPTGVLQPAHFHTGTCAAPGPIVQPLAFPLDGESFTILSAPMSELVDTGLIINVHKSVAEASVYVACGEVLSAAAPPPAPTAAPPPPATPTPATGIVAPSTGTGDSGGGGARGTHVLLVAGMALVLGAGALAFARRRA